MDDAAGLRWNADWAIDLRLGRRRRYSRRKIDCGWRQVFSVQHCSEVKSDQARKIALKFLAKY
jgi:hypothetical protein